MSTTTSLKPNLTVAASCAPTRGLDNLLERDLLPDWLIRVGIRRLLVQRLREEDKGDVERQRARLLEFIRQLKTSPVAIATDAANQQHYEVPAALLSACAGKAPEVQQRPMGSRHDHSGRSRAGDARPDLPACSHRRRAGDLGIRLWVGFAVALHGREIPQ